MLKMEYKFKRLDYKGRPYKKLDRRTFEGGKCWDFYSYYYNRYIKWYNETVAVGKKSYKRKKLLGKSNMNLNNRYKIPD